MFENISFLFLCAMGLLSWAVLCLQHMVEIQRRAASDYRVELYKERPEITFEPQVSHRPLDPSRAVDFAMSFWGILALTFALSKLLQVAERKAKNYLKGLEAVKPVNAVESRFTMGNPAMEPSQDDQKTVDQGEVEENAALREQLNVLETHCLEMRELLHELRMSKSSSSQEYLQSEESIMVLNVTSSIAELGSSSTEFYPHTTSSTQNTQNIYITNSHIHIRGPVFCWDSNYSTALSRQASMYERRQSEFVQVWGKYITGPKERPMISGSMRCSNILT